MHWLAKKTDFDIEKNKQTDVDMPLINQPTNISTLHYIFTLIDPLNVSLVSN